jgi:hypothetical protein
VDTTVPTDVAQLQARVEQLQTALETRIVVEQAKGILAERFRLGVEDAFLLLRYAARSSRRNLRGLAREIVGNRTTPGEITVALARQQRWRAAGQRERAEAHRERASIERAHTMILHEKLRATKRRPDLR